MLLRERLKGLCLWHVRGFGPEHAEREVVDKNADSDDEDNEDLEKCQSRKSITS